MCEYLLAEREKSKKLHFKCLKNDIKNNIATVDMFFTIIYFHHTSQSSCKIIFLSFNFSFFKRGLILMCGNNHLV